jgi:hypothetical protein
MLTPTNVPIAHIELDGHCRQINSPNKSVMIPSPSTQPDPRIDRIWKNKTMSKMPSIRNREASTRLG